MLMMWKPWSYLVWFLRKRHLRLRTVVQRNKRLIWKILLGLAAVLPFMILTLSKLITHINPATFWHWIKSLNWAFFWFRKTISPTFSHKCLRIKVGFLIYRHCSSIYLWSKKLLIDLFHFPRCLNPRFVHILNFSGIFKVDYARFFFQKQVRHLSYRNFHITLQSGLLYS